MDPNAALTKFLEACFYKDTNNAIEALDELNEWIKKGGFLPEVKYQEHYNSDAGGSHVVTVWKVPRSNPSSRRQKEILGSED